MKVVVNRCFGGFSLSDEAEDVYARKAGFELFRYVQTRFGHEKGGPIYERAKESNKASILSYSFKKDHGESFTEWPKDADYWYSRDLERNDPTLVEVVEELGEKANGSCAKLDVVEIPDGISYEIDDYDGQESIHESHRSW